nr:AAA family ATPase [Streptomyces xanthii]
MMVHKVSAYATTGGAQPGQAGAPVHERRAAGALSPLCSAVLDLRAREGCVGCAPSQLAFKRGDLVVVSGLPGSGKSTLMQRAVAGSCIDSQDTREDWSHRVPRLLPYPVYRPLVRLAHYAGLRRALRSGDSVVVHDCGTQAWVRRWLAREAARRGTALHLIIVDVPARTALDGQRERGRGVSGFAFARHRRAMGRLVAATERGVLPRGCVSAVLLDRASADALARIGFTR